jgi:hypothetical protein
MTISAKFAGTCTACGQPIAVGDSIEWQRGVKGSRHTACPAKTFKTIAPVVLGVNQTPAAPAVTLGHAGAALIVKLLSDAKAHLKFPKALFLAPDGKSELRLSLAGTGSKYPGAVQVKVAGNWLGRIAPDGTVTYGIANDKALLATLTTIAGNPAAAAAAYGKFSGHCSFCGKKLTDDRTGSSIEVGYGPVCAKHYGLPHHPTGAAKVLAPVTPVAPASTDDVTVAVKVFGVTDSELPEPAVKKSRFKTVGDVVPGVEYVNVVTGERFVG